MNKKETHYLVGVDVGSTTVKIAVTDADGTNILFSDYKRHNASQAKVAKELLYAAHEALPDSVFRVSVCGSGGQGIADDIGAFFVQEVVANSLAIRKFYPDTSVAIELGGQDAKVVFFRKDEHSGQLMASDMRMNGSCAGGTGAFIDQVAELLHIKTEEFNEYAGRGTHVYDISGRCGVFAKTDIQPLLNQGVSKEDIALSTFHALAKQTIGGLAQGMEITSPVIFEGGPLTFNPILIRVFQERLGLSEDDSIIPDQPEIIVAHGAALAGIYLFKDQISDYKIEKLNNIGTKRKNLNHQTTPLFFETPEDEVTFNERYPLPDFSNIVPVKNTVVEAYLGIDAGSTTSKFVLVNKNGELLYKFYAGNQGDPLGIVQNGLKAMYKFYNSHGAKLKILGAGTTGYGELLFAKAFKADFNTVETVAHAEAARFHAQDVSFILDIGGQDMKAISLNDGIVTGITLNEACSAGCGSFIETYAKSLKINIQDVARLSFKSKNPSVLGSRCTVFMNSSIITEQKNGKTTEDIFAGICRSIIENVFTKVVRISNLDTLGDTILVQGGTFKNDAVLRALEQYTGKNVVRPPYPGVMGAIGIALLTQKEVESTGLKTRFPDEKELDAFSYTKRPGLICELCSNNCMRTQVLFNDGSSFITGNRCERGEVLDGAPVSRGKKVPDVLKLQDSLLSKNYKPKAVDSIPNGRYTHIRIGIPRTLEFWESLPFWKATFESLGVDLVLSDRSSYKIFEQGLQGIPSDTVCFPAKLVHGHILNLVNKKVNRILQPMMIRTPQKNPSGDGAEMCPIVQGYPVVIDKSEETEARYGIALDKPAFHWFNEKMRRSQTINYLHETLGVEKSHAKKAVQQGEIAIAAFKQDLTDANNAILASLESTETDTPEFAVVLAGRPYHADSLINHNIGRIFTALGIPVLNLHYLEGLENEDLQIPRMEAFNPYHARMLEASLMIAKHPKLELAQIISFGCGHDAIISDEMSRILKETSNKELLMLKLDEGEAIGPLTIRIKSFVETIKTRRKRQPISETRQLKDGFPVKFTKKDRSERTILVPNLSPAFSKLTAAVIQKSGVNAKVLDIANAEAIALGKKYVHNDICYPAQINIGEILYEVQKGNLPPNKIAAGLAKNCIACRAGQYASLCRKALDEAGYPEIPIITTGVDPKNMHPGFKMDLPFMLRLLWGLNMVDGLEMMLRRIRPYEANKGETDKTYNLYLEKIVNRSMINYREGLKALAEAVNAFNTIEIKDVPRRPRVGIVGEILMNYHPGSNCYIEEYLENNGMEVYLPAMSDFFRKKNIAEKEMADRGLHPMPFLLGMKSTIADGIADYAHSRTAEVLKDFTFYEGEYDIRDISQNMKDEIDQSYHIGEGWLMPGEIIEMAKHGINSFVIINPFGCLPNHITGRGMIKALKKRYPHIQILALDFDPDTAMANVENRLQMLIMTARELEHSSKN